MKKINAWFLPVATGFLFLFQQAQAQIRYLDPVFTKVEVAYDSTYATNLSILSGTPVPLDLKMDTYKPAGDTATDRPVVVYFHTGSFLPQYFNGQITGERRDSTAVEICTRLAKMGYVAISATYRQGWLALSDDQNVRTGTLLQAAYRSIQDARSLIRYLRKSVAEYGNPYGIDDNKIVLWGQGTGGYISLGCAFLDSYEEEVNIEKFINTETALPYVVPSRDGDIYGVEAAPLNLPNHPGYSSDFALAVNLGGALGDSSWIDGKENEPPVIGYHILTDPLAPYGNGSVIVPTTQEFVVYAMGTSTTTAKANELGLNDVFARVFDANDPINSPLSLYLNAYVDVLKNVQVDLSPLGGSPNTRVGVDHCYPFLPPGNGPGSGYWEWWNKQTVDAVVAGINAQLGSQVLNADALHNQWLFLNPGMSAEKARAYIDTIMTYYTPRAYLALGLTTDVKEAIVQESEVNLKMGPNPTTDVLDIQTSANHPIRDLAVFDMNGRVVRTHFNIQTNSFQIQRKELPPGMYTVLMRFKEGFLTKKIVFY